MLTFCLEFGSGIQRTPVTRQPESRSSAIILRSRANCEARTYRCIQEHLNLPGNEKLGAGKLTHWLDSRPSTPSVQRFTPVPFCRRVCFGHSIEPARACCGDSAAPWRLRPIYPALNPFTWVNQRLRWPSAASCGTRPALYVPSYCN